MKVLAGQPNPPSDFPCTQETVCVCEVPLTTFSIDNHHHRKLGTIGDFQGVLIEAPVAIMSQPALNKIAANSPSRQNPSELETSIATALYELETNIPDLKVALRPLQFVSAREV